jgi:hypothetical protein
VKSEVGIINLITEKNDTCDGHEFNIDVLDDEVNANQKESLMLFEAVCIFGYRKFYNNLL